MPRSARAEADFWPDYIRLDAGLSDYDVGKFSQQGLNDNGGRFVTSEIDNAPFIGAGFGWNLGTWLRLDFTGEYHDHGDLSGADRLRQTLSAPDGIMTVSSTYAGEYSSIVGLANLYADLGTWNGVTPYVGGGIGIAHNKVSDVAILADGSFQDTSTGALRQEFTRSTAGAADKNSFAWALMAGIAMDINDRTKLDVGYRYLNLGQDIAATTAIIDCDCGTVGEPMKIEDLSSHEIRVGLRWQFDPPARHAAPLK